MNKDSDLRCTSVRTRGKAHDVKQLLSFQLDWWLDCSAPEGDGQHLHFQYDWVNRRWQRPNRWCSTCLSIGKNVQLCGVSSRTDTESAKKNSERKPQTKKIRLTKAGADGRAGCGKLTICGWHTEPCWSEQNTWIPDQRPWAIWSDQLIYATVTVNYMNNKSSFKQSITFVACAYQKIDIDR